MKIMNCKPFAICTHGFVAITVWSAFLTYTEAGSPREEKWKAEIPKEAAQMGSSIAISEDMIAVGAFFDGENEEGTVHIFDRETGQGLDVLQSPNAEEGGLFGYSLAWENDLLLVGAPFEDGDGTDDGVVYLFDFNREEVATISSPSGEDGQAFGVSLAIENGLALIGSPYEKGEGTKRGAVYVYDLENRQFVQRLAASDPADDDQLGLSVSLSGGIAAVGAWRKSHPDGADNSGAVYLFKALTGAETLKIDNPNPQNIEGPFGNFGCSVLIRDNQVIVGARKERHSIQGPDDFKEGVAYMFDVTTGEQLRRFVSPRSTGDSFFGNKLARERDFLLIAATQDSTAGDNAGAAYLFDVNTGREIQQILASDASPNDEFGFSVALSGMEAFIGARFEGEDPERASGALYRYTFGYQPDLLIGKTKRNVKGGDRYNNSGAGQRIKIRSRGRIRYSFQAQNDGSLPDRLHLKSRRKSKKFRYRIKKAGAGNVAGALARGNYRSSLLFPGEMETFRVVAKPRGRNRKVRRETNLIRSRSLQNVTKTDAAKAKLHRRR